MSKILTSSPTQGHEPFTRKLFENKAIELFGVPSVN